MRCRTNCFYAKRKHQRERRREKNCRERPKNRRQSHRRRNNRMRKPVRKFRQQREHYRKRQHGQQLTPKEVCRLNGRKLQKFKGVTFTLPCKTICRQGRTHRGHEATEQKHHVTFHTLHNLSTVTRHGNRLGSRKNHRRNNEGNPESRIPKNQSHFVFKYVKHNTNVENFQGRAIFYIWIARNQGVFMSEKGEHNKWIALALCILLGYLGLHRFYEGKIWTGILWLCTGGLLGVGVVVDAILIVMKPEHY